MFYKCDHDHLMEFLLDPINTPIRKTGGLAKTRHKLLSIPLFSNFLRKEDIDLFFIEKLNDLKSKCVSEIPLIKPKTLTTIPHQGNECAKNIKKHIHYHLDLPSINIGLENKYIFSCYQSCAWYFTNLICETIRIHSNCDIDVSNSPCLIKLFAIAEIYTLWKLGILDARPSRNHIYLTINSAYLSDHKRYWFSEYIERKSEISLISEKVQLNKFTRTDKKINPYLLYALVDQTLDKEFSIHKDFISNDLRTSKEYKLIKNIVALATLIDAATLESQSIKVDKGWVRRQMIFDEEFLEYFDQQTAGTENKLGEALGFIFSNEHSYFRGTLGFKYGIRKIIGKMLHNHPNKSFDISHILGEVFETNHILKRLKQFDKFGYTAYPGFKPKSKKSKIKYDIDIVIHDTERNIYFFVQVAYKKSLMPVYFSERVRESNRPGKGNIRYKIDQQLINLKEHFNHESVRNKIKDKPYSGANWENSYFMLLSNLSHLNFYKQDEILFYEWNTLRNLIQNGKVLAVSNETIREKFVGGQLPLHDPDAIVDNYVKSGLFEENTDLLLSLYLNTKCKINIDGAAITYPLI